MIGLIKEQISHTNTKKKHVWVTIHTHIKWTKNTKIKHDSGNIEIFLHCNIIFNKFRQNSEEFTLFSMVILILYLSNYYYYYFFFTLMGGVCNCHQINTTNYNGPK